MFRSIAITLTLCLATATAQAALLGRAALTPGGTDYQAYYDDVLNITWLADANLAVSNSFGVTATWVPTGSMNWAKVNEWIGAMNTANYLGTNDWRLPTVTDTGTSGCNFAYTGTDCGYNVDPFTGEMAHMFYSTLGNLAFPWTGALLPPYGLTNTGPFVNLQASNYWSGTTYAPDPNQSWFFGFSTGHQTSSNHASGFYAWAVRSGDIGVVPVPAAVWLFGSALGLMGVMRRKLAS